MNRKDDDSRKEAMLLALEKSLGVVTTACKEVGLARHIHYQWLKDDEEYSKKVDDCSNIALDFGESQLFKQIRAGNATSTIFFLKTKGKKRGYSEKDTNVISVDKLSKLPPEILRQVLAAIEE